MKNDFGWYREPKVSVIAEGQLLNISTTQLEVWQLLDPWDRWSWWRGRDQMEGKKEQPKPRKLNDTKEDVPTWHEAKSVMFKSELPTPLIDFQIFPPPFLASTPIIF